MKVRSISLLLIALGLLTSCAAEKAPPPLDAAHYAADIVFCEQKAEPASQSCDEVESPAATVFANVLAGNVDGRVVQIETDSPLLGTVKGEEIYVRQGETFSEWFEIDRSSCRELPCTIALSVYVDYQLILTESITFT